MLYALNKYLLILICLPYSKSTLHRAFNRVCRKSGITKHITIHGLRHTHAVLLLESGASLKDVQERLGHKSIQTTAMSMLTYQKNSKKKVWTDIQITWIIPS
ncbi:tyrosine-type recombinase/integrase [Peribacillus frigoritolerans]|uniref:tyrosine-type recombinase/integrase n=1 Tax=Peribacillus frigoritolerans TaxID=450367 RepID=UPI002E1BE6C6|nr:tyrosine-type recombinase/integrase [Peribacillus frigoritolerans]MED3790289.1 tyrosine-type recombinase/integrase [Peribacillus frigoritolerans]